MHFLAFWCIFLKIFEIWCVFLRFFAVFCSEFYGSTISFIRSQMPDVRSQNCGAAGGGWFFMFFKERFIFDALYHNIGESQGFF